jgi:DnaK suppressor protein
MEVFDKSMKPRFSRSLDEREEQLRAMLRASSDSKNIPFEDAPHEVMDFKDVATGQIQDTVDGAKAEYATLELQQVQAARNRLHEGSYGYCLNCSNAIDLRRLDTLPAAPLCTPCQANLENAQAHQKQR